MGLLTTLLCNLIFSKGTAPGRDSPKAFTKYTSATARRRTEQLKRTAGGRRRSQEKCGEAASGGSSSGKRIQEHVPVMLNMSTLQ